jgi:hypothetical protein
MMLFVVIRIFLRHAIGTYKTAPSGNAITR